MSQIKLSIGAAQNVKKISEDTKDKLINNIKILDGEVNSIFASLQDPTVKKYLELSENLQKSLTGIAQSIEGIEEYCNAVIAWIQGYNKI